MSVVAVVGPSSSTTALALASAARQGSGPDDVLLVEADPAGGVYAAWLDLPSRPGLASSVASPTTSSLTDHAQTSRGGLRVVVAPVRSV